MSTVRVTVLNALSSRTLLEDRICDCKGFVRTVRLELGHRPSRPVALFLGGALLSDDFEAANGAVLELTAAFGQGVSEEEREAVARRLETIRPYELHREFPGLSEAARDDFGIVLAAVRRQGSLLKHASEACRSDKRIVLEALRQDPSPYIFSGASQELRNDIDIALEAVRGDPRCLQHAGEAVLNDKNVMLEAVRWDPCWLSYAGDDCRDDDDILREIESFMPPMDSENGKGKGKGCKGTCKAGMRFGNPELMLEVVRSGNPCILHSAFDAVLNDKRVMLEAIQQCTTFFDFAGEEVRNDKDVLLYLVRIDAGFLEYAGKEVRNSREFMLEAVRLDPYCLEYAGPAVLNDKQVMLEAVRWDPCWLRHAGRECRNDEDILREIESSMPPLLLIATGGKGRGCKGTCKSARRFNSPELMLEAVRLNPYCLVDAGPAVLNDKQVMLEAVRWDPCWLRYAGIGCCNDEDILREIESFMPPMHLMGKAKGKGKGCKGTCKSGMRFNSPELVLEVVRSGHPECLNLAGRDVTDDQQVMLEAVRQDPRWHRLAGKCQNDEEILRELKKGNANRIENGRGKGNVTSPQDCKGTQKGKGMGSVSSWKRTCRGKVCKGCYKGGLDYLPRRFSLF